MSAKDTSTITQERYALARHGMPLSGRIATPVRGHWFPAAIKNPMNATLTTAAPQTLDAATDSNETDDWWDMEVSKLDLGDEHAPLARSVVEQDTADAHVAAAAASTLRESPALTDKPAGSALSAHEMLASGNQIQTADGTHDTRSQVSRRNDKDDVVTTSTAVSERVGDAHAIAHAAIHAHDMSPPNMLDSHQAAVSGTQRKGRIGACEPGEATAAAAIDQLATYSDGIATREADTSKVDAIPAAKTITSAERTVAAISSESATTREYASSKIANRNDTATVVETGQGRNDRQFERDNSIDAQRSSSNRASNPGPHARSIEMGMPTVSLPRPTGDAPSLNRIASPPGIDAAQIASLLAPAASTGPRVNIDRVQVTVQTPSSLRPASHPAQAPMPSPQSSAISRGHSNASSYRSPWASYFTRRD
jgi:hypothetical protein